MRLVLCDDNRILCEALAAALEPRGPQTLAMATTASDGVAAVAGCHPDACLLDLWFPGGEDGLGAARAIRQKYPDTAVLVLSPLTDPATSAQAREIGVVTSADNRTMRSRCQADSGGAHREYARTYTDGTQSPTS